MKFAEYEELLRKRLGTYFDFKTDVTLDGRIYPLVAEHTARLEQTVLGKDNVVDYFDTREFCVLSRHASISRDGLEAELARARNLVKTLAKPCRTHKSTMITRILAVESSPAGEAGDKSARQPFEHAVRRLIGRFRHSRAHLFFFHGWTDLRVFVVDLGTAEVLASPLGRRDKAPFSPVA